MSKDETQAMNTVKEEFEATFGKRPDTPFKQDYWDEALRGAKWAIERCAEEAHRYAVEHAESYDKSISGQRLADYFRTLSESMGEL